MLDRRLGRRARILNVLLRQVRPCRGGSGGEQLFRPTSRLPLTVQDFEEPDMDKEQEKAAKARDAALTGALTQIERQFGKGSIMRMGDEDAKVRVDAIPTGAL